MPRTRAVAALLLHPTCLAPPPLLLCQGLPEGGMRRIILTASGGAFRDLPVEKLAHGKAARTGRGLHEWMSHMYSSREPAAGRIQLRAGTGRLRTLWF